MQTNKVDKKTEEDKSLVIVESPNKIKSIKKYLGSKYDVLASMGHIYELSKSPYILTDPSPKDYGVTDFEDWDPIYKISKGKSKLIKELKAASKKANKVYIATDPDREGEAIAQNLVDALDINDKYFRIRFNEITEKSILKSLEHPEKIDNHLVDSQIARRILDRLIGFKLSGLLREKIKNSSSKPSAGRVQSIALKLVVEKDQEIQKFISEKYFLINLILDGDFQVNFFDAKSDLENKEWIYEKDIDQIFEKINQSKELKVVEFKNSKKKDKKNMPLKQSSLYKRGYSSLGMSSKSIQVSAQKLYEGYGDGGLISYPRTDSTRLSEDFVKDAKTFIEKKFGKNYVSDEIKSSKGAQDAHEAIRPTSFELTPSQAKAKFDLSEGEFKVYKLIYDHTLSCLMESPIRSIVRYELEDENKFKFKISFSKVIFDGYLKINNFIQEEQKYPDWQLNQMVSIKKVNKEEYNTKPPAYYNEGSLIETLDEIGVGRPSTFSTTVNILRERDYVKLDTKQLIPSDFGKIVYEKLMTSFKNIMNESYTAEVEEKLDEIANGNFDHKKLLTDFWKKFNIEYDLATKELTVTKVPPLLANKKCPNCGDELLIRKNKKNNNQFLGCSNFPNCKYTESDPNSKPQNFKYKKNFKKKT